MPTIAQIRLPPDWRPAGLWDALAAHTLAWLGQQALVARDAVLLLPFAGLLEPARAAFAARGGWQPRIETALTLAASLGPPPVSEPGQCCGDVVLDGINASRLLRAQPWGQAWAARDGTGFDSLVAALVDAAQALLGAAAARAPAHRAAFWASAHAEIAALPSTLEASLLGVALQWAREGQEAVAPATDALFAHHPAAWIVLRLAGADALCEALLGHGDTPSLLLDADPDADAPFDSVAANADLHQLSCDDAEAEAQATAAAVIEAVNRGAVPVALVALDRELLRRVRALLERAQLPVIDETGWKLATTAAATTLLAPLRAALPGATRDDQLLWLKSSRVHDAAALASLEALWRRRRHVADAPAARALWALAQQRLEALQSPRVQPLAAWLQALTACLQADGLIDALEADRAGQQVMLALGLRGERDAAWHEAATGLRLSLAEFSAWVGAALESATFLPLPDPGAVVLITPLARAFGRPFSQVVIPATDHRHLGAAAPATGLIHDALARRLGLPDAAAHQARQQLALAHALRADATLLLRRHRDDREPLAPSPLVEWLLLARARHQRSPWPSTAWRAGTHSVPAAPVGHPQPVGSGRLPSVLSASQLEALRQCPYRFFARAVLRLDEPEELEAALAKRDYGSWLHALLHHFHGEREFGADDAAQLEQAARAATAELGLDEGELLPFAASFERLAPAYLAWLHEREARGWYWADGESDHRFAHPAWQGLQLRGRIDRLDHGPDDARQLIDYKTGRTDALRKRVKEPLEDTQLAFYAALLGGDAQLSASYLALDDDDSPREVPHEQVQHSAAVLVEQLGSEWQRMQQGQPLPALGEGAVCETCEARGLCRRDHWAVE